MTLNAFLKILDANAFIHVVWQETESLRSDSEKMPSIPYRSLLQRQGKQRKIVRSFEELFLSGQDQSISLQVQLQNLLVQFLAGNSFCITYCYLTKKQKRLKALFAFNHLKFD